MRVHILFFILFIRIFYINEQGSIICLMNFIVIKQLEW